MIDEQQISELKNFCNVIAIRSNDGPTVFLIDELHHDRSIIDNIKIASSLIDKYDVKIIGVEGYSSLGCSFNKSNKDFSFAGDFDSDLTKCECINDCAYFAQTMKRKNIKIVGVDSKELCTEMENDAEKGTWPKEFNSHHPNNYYRSRFFLKVLFYEYNKLGGNGNMILNCGSDHNSHIFYSIYNNDIDSIINFRASYIRLRSFDFTYPKLDYLRNVSEAVRELKSKGQNII